MNKRDLIIVALATFCLTSTLFMILPSRSTDYNPWADTSGPDVGESDGRINMRDIQYEIMLFNTNGSTTRDVNVTNWMPPEPTVVWCGDYEFNSSTLCSIGPPAPSYVYVGDYERMTVTLVFHNVQNPGQTCYLTACAQWMTLPTGRYYYYPTDKLTSTLYDIQNLGPFAIAQCVSTDSYPIKAPYVFVFPTSDTLFAVSQGFDTTFSVYAYLSNGPTSGSTRKTMRWDDVLESTASSYTLGPFELSGFSQITLALSANVTTSARVYLGDTQIDSFSFSGPYINKNYALTAVGWFRLSITPSTRPFWVSVAFCVSV